MSDYILYAIGLKENLILPYVDCYIGVTNHQKHRWSIHQKSKYIVGEYIRENLLCYEENMIILYSGSKEECFKLEKTYRPFPYMGLNISPGGCGGYTSYLPERNNKISMKLKGIPKSKEHKLQSSKTKREKQLHVGSKNGRAKKWILISPEKNIYNINGLLAKFCQEHNLLVVPLRRYRNKIVPPPNYNGTMGGFRPINVNQKILRENTTGWMLSEIGG